MHRYYLYGLYIESEIKLYNIDEVSDNGRDVWVHYGTLSPDILDKYELGIRSVASEDRVWFANDIGVFLIERGEEIVVSLLKGEVPEEEVASFVLGWGVAFLFQQRGIPAIHSTALSKNGNVFLISGESGAGKSTLALELIKRGYKYLCDDISMVDYRNGMTIEPAYPIQKVCRDVYETIDNKSLLIYVNERKDKFAYKNLQEFCCEKGIVKKVFFIRKGKCENVEMEKLKGIDLWNAVANSLFLIDAYKALGFPEFERQRTLAIAGQIEGYRLTRPEEGNTVKEMCDAIVALLGE